MASGVDLGGDFAANGVDEGLVDFGLRLGVEEAEEAETEDQSRREVAAVEGELGAEEERVEALEVLVHSLSPAYLFSLLLQFFFFYLRSRRRGRRW